MAGGFLPFSPYPSILKRPTGYCPPPRSTLILFLMGARLRPNLSPHFHGALSIGARSRRSEHDEAAMGNHEPPLPFSAVLRQNANPGITHRAFSTVSKLRDNPSEFAAGGHHIHPPNGPRRRDSGLRDRSPAPEPRDRRQTRRTGALLPNSGGPPLPLADQSPRVEAHVLEIGMTGPPPCWFEAAPPLMLSPAAPPRMGEAGCAAGTTRSFTSLAWNPDREPSFGDHMAEEVTALCREKYGKTQHWKKSWRTCKHRYPG